MTSTSKASIAGQTQAKEAGALECVAFRVTEWSERWFPDAYIFAPIAVALVTGVALMMGTPIDRICVAFGDGVRSLVQFTMQMAVTTISGYVVAVSPPAARLIERLARLPRSGPFAIAFVALKCLSASVLNWAISAVFSGLPAKAIARLTDIRMDYRAAGEAAYLGMGASGPWASAPQLS